MGTKSQRLAIQAWLAGLAVCQRVPLSDPRIEAARADALLYVSEGMSPKEAVAAAAVHAFKLYGLPSPRRSLP